jgi:hypothetical protein
MNWTLRIVVWALVGVIANVEPAESSDTSDFNPDFEAINARSRREDAIFNPLLDIANASRKPIRVYYSTVCPKDKTPEFPSVKMQPTAKGKTGLDAVRDIFANDENVKVTEDGGIIRIWIGQVPTAILQTKVDQIRLTPEAQYSPGSAFYELLSSTEMVKAEQALKYSPPITYSNATIRPNKKLPHLPPTIRDATAEEVLDKMAKAFTGEVIVIYGACSEKDESGITNFWLAWQGQIGGD